MSKPKVLGLIPAKGGSTRFPKKNIALLAGIPLIAWANKSLIEANICDRIILSTEDEEVACVAREHNIEVPFLRPQQLGIDPAGVVDVALHALKELEAEGESFDILVIALPTSPLRTAEDVHGAFQQYQSQQAKFLMSVSEYEHTPFAALDCDDAGVLKPYFEQHFGKKSQEMPKAYRPNGAIHVLNVEAFKAAKTYFGQPLFAYEMSQARSVDVDTPLDLEIAKALMSSVEEKSKAVANKEVVSGL